MRWIVGSTIALLVTYPALAKDKAPLALPESFQKLIACRDEANAATRLDCFDRNAAVLDAAAKSRDIIVAANPRPVASTAEVIALLERAL